MMRPPLRSRFAASRQPLNVPFRLMAIMRIERGIIGFGKARELHNAGVVHHHVNAAEGCFRSVEHAADGCWIAHVCLCGQGASTGCFDLAGKRFSFGLVACIVDELAAGALAEVLPDFPPSPSPVYVLYPQNRQLSPRVRVFIDWLASEFADRILNRAAAQI